MRANLTTLLSRCLRLRCPVCGQSSIVASPFQIRHHCPSCRALFKREEGFFVGAIAINVVTTEAVILLTYVASMPIINTHFQPVLAALVVIALLFPLAYYHHSWSVWLAFDHLVEKLPKMNEGDDAR
jgi:hypothetical protein